MSQNSTILVLGASGQVGSNIVRTLATNPHLSVRGSYRKPEAATKLAELGIEPVFVDLDQPQTIAAALVGVEGLLLLTGYSVDMLRQSLAVIVAAKAAGVRHIVHIGASGNRTTAVAHWGWHRYIEAMIEREGFDYTHLQPEAFMQNLKTFGWLSDDGTLLNPIGDARWCWIDAEDVAAIAAEALARPHEFHNQTWQLGYEAASMAEVASLLNDQAGQKYIKLQALESEVFYASAVENGADPAYMACVRDQFQMNARNEIADADATFSSEAFKRAVGRAPRSWKHAIRVMQSNDVE